MTDMDFQYQLAQIQVSSLATATDKTTETFSPIQTELEAERKATGGEKQYDGFMDNLWNSFTGTLAYMYGLFRPAKISTKALTPTKLSVDINPGKGLTGAAREKAIAKYNATARAEKEMGLPKKQKAFKKALAQVDAENAALAESENLSEPEKFDRAMELLEQSSRGEVVTDESLFDNPEEANEADIPITPDELITEQGITNLKRVFLREPGYKGNLLLEAAEALQAILAAPEGGIERLAGREGLGSELYATQQAQDLSPTTTSLEQAIKNNALPETSTMSALKRMFTTRQAYLTLRKKYQNSRDVLKRTEIAAELAEKIEYAGSKINAVYTAIIGSSGIARNYYLSKVEPHEYALRKAIGKYAEKMGVSVEDAVVRLHLIG
jgi:hypothetical protein